jgi:NADPH:quinone reductase-like Zn-dependent oxidoreductase
LERSIKTTALDGQINFVGRFVGSTSTLDTNILCSSAAAIRVVFAGNRAQFIEMNRAIAANRLTPIIDRVYPAAFRYYEDARPLGKVVIRHELRRKRYAFLRDP